MFPDHINKASYLDKKTGIDVGQLNILEILYRIEYGVSYCHKEEIKENEWNYFPFSHLSFYKALEKVVGEKNKDISFLELGCGLGTKLYIARNLCGIWRVTGIEKNSAYVKIAESAFSVDVINMDLNDFDNYQNYDVIYSYLPLKDPHNEKLMDKVKSKMKKGAVLLTASYGDRISKWTKRNAIKE